MSSSRNVNIDLDPVRQIRSVRRAAGWMPTQNTVAGKILIGFTSFILLGGIVATVVTPFVIAATKSISEDVGATMSTSITFTTTTATTSTATSSTSVTSTTTTSTTTTTTATTTTKTTTSTTSTITSTTKTTTTMTSTSTSSTTSTTTAPPSTICSSSGSTAVLYSNQFIYSPTGHFYAAGMLNNQFGVYNAYGYSNVTSTAVWTASQSSTPAGAYFAAQNDRNLVVYTTGGTPIWSANVFISGLSAAFCLQMLDNGNLIWTNTTNSIIWQSNSAVG